MKAATVPSSTCLLACMIACFVLSALQKIGSGLNAKVEIISNALS